MKRNHTVLVIILFIYFLSFLTGCQKEDDHFQVMVFSSLPESSLEKMKVLASDLLGDDIDFDIKMYPPIFERIIVEVVDHAGDILIMERELLSSIYDKEGLYQLDTLGNKENAIELNNFEQEALLADGEATEAVDIYPNALRVINYGPFIGRDEDGKPLEIVAVIPKYTAYEEISFELSKKLVQK